MSPAVVMLLALLAILLVAGVAVGLVLAARKRRQLAELRTPSESKVGPEGIAEVGPEGVPEVGPEVGSEVGSDLGPAEPLAPAVDAQLVPAAQPVSILVPPRVRAVAPPIPIVLVHGLLGFEHLAVLGRQFAYFRGVAERLRDAGALVYAVKLPPLASVPDRAQILASFVAALPHERVNLIAHSMGGLDARYALARLGLHERVGSLVTIATPHQGTPLADLGAAPPLRALRSLIGMVGLHTHALDWLTTAQTGTFNRDIPDMPGVLYASIVARARWNAILANPVLLSGHTYLRGRAGANDGMVPAESQRWGEVLAEIDADHWAQIGWSRYFDAGLLYLQLLDSLRNRGL